MSDVKFSEEAKCLAAATFIQHRTRFKPRFALVLGSGLSHLTDRLNVKASIRSSEIPFYPLSSVQGHTGRLVFGYLLNDFSHSTPLLVFQGRVHFYESESLERVLFPIAIAQKLGVHKIIMTNAAGGINSCFSTGDLMLIHDVVNLSFIPLPLSKTLNDSSTHRHSIWFDELMKRQACTCAAQLKIPLQQGTYGWLRGPSYETPAEIQMLKRIGVDAVGMSTVPEMFLAHRFGMEILGLSLISNLAAGISPVKLSHAEVTETGKKVGRHFSELLENLILSLH
jgi:purine-nucleoside phosphorylase